MRHYRLGWGGNQKPRSLPILGTPMATPGAGEDDSPNDLCPVTRDAHEVSSDVTVQLSPAGSTDDELLLVPCFPLADEPDDDDRFPVDAIPLVEPSTSALTT